MSQLVGLIGYARSGKDTVADYLVANHSYQKVAFADPLRDFLCAQNPWVSGPQGLDAPPRRWRDLFDSMGWDAMKTDPVYGESARSLIQATGTEAGREVLGRDVWVNAAFSRIRDDSPAVLPDCRFENEATAILEAGGRLIRIIRPGISAVNSHASEHELNHYFTEIIMNDGTIEDLNRKIEEKL